MRNMRMEISLLSMTDGDLNSCGRLMAFNAKIHFLLEHHFYRLEKSMM